MGSLRLGRDPVAPSWVFESTPVIFLSIAIAKIADDPARLGNVYNVVQQDPLPVDQVRSHEKHRVRGGSGAFHRVAVEVTANRRRCR